MFDFGKLDKPKKTAAHTDPREIFRTRPSGQTGAKELWQGQAKALSEWFKSPESSTLISMYTGAGKTIVGCLIAQSYLNQGYANVVYACPTTDLILQTQKEASRIGLQPSTYFHQKFSDDRFHQGKSFCITTYQALLITRSKFRGQSRPGAMVFDDAHVGERLVREAFTIVFPRKNPGYERMGVALRPLFAELGLQHAFDDATSADDSIGSVLWAPPSGVLKHQVSIEAALKSSIDKDINLVFPYDYLRGKVAFCAITVSKSKIEISPPFLPAPIVDCLEDNSVPRVYLSATVQSKGDIARAFGRLPQKIIEPEVDAGRGERLIIFGSKMAGVVDSPETIRALAQNHKVLVSIPGTKKATKWDALVKAPEDFSAELNAFRKAKVGFFALVGRYDGIDLPDEECRVMIIDGLPIGSAQVERYCYETLHMDKAFVSRIANRLTQLFGRINRGKNDFGLYLVFDRETENWLRNSRNLSYLPSILREQILLAEDFEQQINGKMNSGMLSSIIAQVISRDAGWVDYYQAHLGDKEIDNALIADRDDSTKIMDTYAKCEVNFVTKLWSNDLGAAAGEFGKNLDDLAKHDPKLAGWYYAWMGVANEAIGQAGAAQSYYSEARQKGSARLPLPKPRIADTAPASPEAFAIERGIREYALGTTLQVDRAIAKTEGEAASIFDPEASHRKAEESLRVIGSALGFQASRPCNDVGTGPDGLWLDEFRKEALAFELKSEKDDASVVGKEDVGQSHNHIQWVADSHPEYKLIGLLIMAESEAISPKASPSPLMRFVTRSRIRQLWNEFTDILRQHSKRTEIERFAAAKEVGEESRWRLKEIFGRLSGNE